MLQHVEQLLDIHMHLWYMQMIDDPNFDPTHETRSPSFAVHTPLDFVKLNEDGTPVDNFLLTDVGQDMFVVGGASLLLLTMMTNISIALTCVVHDAVVPMQKPIGLFVTSLLTSEVTTVDMFMWNRQARAHDKAAVLAAMYLSKEFQEFMNKLAFPLPMGHVKAWFCVDAEPLPPKKRTELALQKRAEAGLTANTWGGSALFGARLSQRLSSVRVAVVSPSRCNMS